MGMDWGEIAGQAGGALNDFGTAFGDLTASKGSKEAAKSFGEAASLEDENAQIAKASGAIEQAQMGRAVYQNMSQATAAMGGNGLKLTGSGQDILRSSAQQGALAGAKIGAQTQVQVTGYEAQAGAYRSQQKQEEMLSKSQQSSGGMSAMGGIMQMAGMAMMFL